MLIKKISLILLFILILIFIVFSDESQDTIYFNSDYNTFFKFENDVVYFSKFKENDNLIPFQYTSTKTLKNSDNSIDSSSENNIDASSDTSYNTITIFDTPTSNKELILEIIDENTFYCNDPVFSGEYIKLDNLHKCLIDIQITNDTNYKLEILTNVINNFNENDNSSDKAEIFNSRGLIYYNQNDYNSAFDDYTKAIELDPENSQYYLNRGFSSIYKNENNLAKDDFQKSIDLNTDSDESSFFAIGCLKYFDGNDSEAIIDLSTAIDKNINFAEAYNFRGLAFTNLGEYEKAISDFTQTINLNSDNKDIYVNRGKAYAKLLDYENAFFDFEKAGFIPEDNYHTVAKYYFNKGNYKTAKNFFDKAIIKNPEDYQLYLDRGFCNITMEDYQKANFDFTKVINYQPNLFEGYFFRGITYFCLNQNSKSISDFGKAIELKNDSPHSYILRLASSLKVTNTEYQKYLKLTLDNLNNINDIWEKSLVEYFCGLIDTSSLLYSTLNNKNNENDKISTAYFYIGLKNQLKGTLLNAKTSYQISKDTKTNYFTNFLSSYLLKNIK